MNWTFIRDVGPLRWAWRTAVRQYYKRIARRDHRILLPGGEWMNLPIDDRFATEVFVTNANVDWSSERLLYSLLERRGVLIDVGAHIGYYSLYMLPRVTAVYCFEPDPRARRMLEDNVKNQQNVFVFPWAVGEAAGRARFVLEEHAELSHLGTETDDPNKFIVVDAVTIDSFVSTRHLEVEIIKIDVEGHDAEVVLGATRVLREQQPLVLTEAKFDTVLLAIARQVSYRVFAYVRLRGVRIKPLMELIPDQPLPGETKMLFLVPQRLANRFEELAAKEHDA